MNVERWQKYRQLLETPISVNTLKIKLDAIIINIGSTGSLGKILKISYKKKLKFCGSKIQNKLKKNGSKLFEKIIEEPKPNYCCEFSSFN